MRKMNDKFSLKVFWKQFFGFLKLSVVLLFFNTFLCYRLKILFILFSKKMSFLLFQEKNIYSNHNFRLKLINPHKNRQFLNFYECCFQTKWHLFTFFPTHFVNFSYLNFLSFIFDLLLTIQAIFAFFTLPWNLQALQNRDLSHQLPGAAAILSLSL